MQKRQIELRINGNSYQIEVEPNELLLNVIRDRLGLTGSKYGCGIGECGVCTVLMEARPVFACLTLAVMSQGKEILTIEGLVDSKTETIQDTFIENGAVQCGFCTPGMVTMAKSLLDSKPMPREHDIKEYLRGNICRCTGYINIIKSIGDAAAKIRQKEKMEK